MQDIPAGGHSDFWYFFRSDLPHDLLSFFAFCLGFSGAHDIPGCIGFLKFPVPAHGVCEQITAFICVRTSKISFEAHRASNITCLSFVAGEYCFSNASKIFCEIRCIFPGFLRIVAAQNGRVHCQFEWQFFGISSDFCRYYGANWHSGSFAGFGTFSPDV